MHRTVWTKFCSPTFIRLSTMLAPAISSLDKIYCTHCWPTEPCFFPLWVLWLSGEWAVGIGVIFDGEDVGAAAIWLLCSKNDASEVTIWKSNAELYYIDKSLGHDYSMKVHSKEKTSTNFGLVSCPVGRVICGFLSRDDNGKSTWLRYSGVNEVKIYCCEIPKTSSARRTRR